ncbi:hypothetical protein CROQUDRAFT_90287 [Cronartium quercuum f. sp. fusiforme G11]|uniref:Uncharacterized protein n=1 Tax=Cronartium quercuum f. sp. fusiforme G11 TaxID=708437 RepID=A0A9P6NJW9_9BASI|nr:hypothetical protein CROQUDRAFT_90287 [Cronartium quercuum f. sp. fusiforme G11]
MRTSLKLTGSTLYQLLTYDLADGKSTDVTLKIIPGTGASTSMSESLQYIPNKSPALSASPFGIITTARIQLQELELWPSGFSNNRNYIGSQISLREVNGKRNRYFCRGYRFFHHSDPLHGLKRSTLRSNVVKLGINELLLFGMDNKLISQHLIIPRTFGHVNEESQLPYKFSGIRFEYISEISGSLDRHYINAVGPFFAVP